MCGVIVVDACRSQSTCLVRDAYIYDHCLGYHHDYSVFYQLPNCNLFTHCMLFSREKPLVNTMAPGSTFIIYKIQKYLAAILLPLFHFIHLSLRDLILAINRRGIDNPLIALGANICYFVCRYC